MRFAKSVVVKMERHPLILLSFFMCVLFAREVVGREWRGIVPLQSTRTDVVRLFGNCSDHDGGCKFRVGNEEASIVFSSEFDECTNKLPQETVLLIEVQLKPPVNLGSLRIDKKKFRTFDPSSPPNLGYKGYINEKEGLVIKTHKGKVLQLDYIAAEKDVPLCPGYYDHPNSFIQLLIEGCCAPLSVNCPTKAPLDGERVTFSADTVGPARARYKWKVSAGKIVSGQGTLRITVDTTGVGGRTITATIEMNGGNNDVTTSSCAVPVSAHPVK